MGSLALGRDLSGKPLWLLRLRGGIPRYYELLAFHLSVHQSDRVDIYLAPRTGVFLRNKTRSIRRYRPAGRVDRANCNIQLQSWVSEKSTYVRGTWLPRVVCRVRPRTSPIGVPRLWC